MIKTMILLCVCRAPGSVESCILTRDTATPLAGLSIRARLSSTQAGDMAATRGIILSWKTDLLFVLLRYSELAAHCEIRGIIYSEIEIQPGV